MKTIEIKSGNQTAQFTTKSVTFDGKEYFYSKMSDVKNFPDKKVYYFLYGDEKKLLPYEEKDSKVLQAIFSQVINLQPHKAVEAHEKPQVETPVAKDTAEEKPSKIEKTDVKNIFAEKEMENKNTVSDVDTVAEETEAPEDQEEMPEAAKDEAMEEPKESEAENSEIDDNAKEEIAPQQPLDKKAAKEAEKAKKQAEKEKKRAEKEKLRAEKAKLKAEKKGEASTEGEEDSAASEMKAKRIKSFKIFGIIIAAVILVSVGYYFIFGTSDNPSKGPNSSESQQYDDIDELINDLQ